MSIIGNIFWFIFIGLISGLGWILAGILCCITIIGIPLGLQSFKMAGLTFCPFGKEVVYGGGAVSFLANADTKPVALLIPQYEAQSFLECSAFISLLILCCNLLVKAAVHLLKSAIARRNG